MEPIPEMVIPVPQGRRTVPLHMASVAEIDALITACVKAKTALIGAQAALASALAFEGSRAAETVKAARRELCSAHGGSDALLGAGCEACADELTAMAAGEGGVLFNVGDDSGTYDDKDAPVLDRCPDCGETALGCSCESGEDVTDSIAASHDEEAADAAFAKLHPDPYKSWVNGEQPAPDNGGGVLADPRIERCECAHPRTGHLYHGLGPRSNCQMPACGCGKYRPRDGIAFPVDGPPAVVAGEVEADGAECIVVDRLTDPAFALVGPMSRGECEAWIAANPHESQPGDLAVVPASEVLARTAGAS